MCGAEETFVGVIDEGVSSTRFLVYTIIIIYFLLYFKNIVV